MFFKNAALIAGLGLIAGSCHQVVEAEGYVAPGGGQHGVNRRVKTYSGYVGVSGDFQMDFGLPGPTITNPANGDQGVAAASNTLGSSPSFYLGGRGPNLMGGEFEVDAGLQYDWDLNDDAYGRTGWEAFINRHGIYTHPRIAQNGVWTIWRGQGRYYHLSYDVDEFGYIKLNVAGTTPLGTFYWNPAAMPNVPSPGNPPNTVSPGTPNGAVAPDYGVPVMNPNTLNSQSVKRVIAMTRPAAAAPHQSDGSSLTCSFRNGTLVYLDPVSNGRTEEEWGLTGYNGDIIDQGETGYDTPANPAGDPAPNSPGAINSPAIDARLANGWPSTSSRYKVDFLNLTFGPSTPPATVQIGRTNLPVSQQATEVGSSSSRYKSETVGINLRTATGILGLPLLLGPPAP